MDMVNMNMGTLHLDYDQVIQTLQSHLSQNVLRNLERKDNHMYGDLICRNNSSPLPCDLFNCMLSTTTLYHHMSVRNEMNLWKMKLL